MTVLPPFTEEGMLPPGDYALSFDELRASHLVTGEHSRNLETWDSEWRLTLLNNAETMVQQLWQCDITEIYLDGSFVEDKSHPNDIDGYFVCSVQDIASDALPKRLNLIDPYKIWTWDHRSRRAANNYAKPQLPMWHRYRVELYPHYRDFESTSGIRDEFGNPQTFPAAFRKSRRAHIAKGIIRIATPTIGGIRP